MGLVITAKSIVRYPQLSHPEFAEYYLLGTLFSVVLALASSFLVLGEFSMEYIALKFDMIGSRRLHERDDVQKHFLLMAAEINKKFAEVLEAEFIVTHGDEAQALLKRAQAPMVFRLFEHISISMKEVSFRCGVGLGTLSTSVQEKLSGWMV